ncbi:unnamed protein product, partial [Owenia fusiformis]
SLLDELNLICSISPMPNHSETVYIVPQLLPITDLGHQVWVPKPVSQNHEYYIDFQHFYPESIFTRLLCVCLRHQLDCNYLSPIKDATIYRHQAWCTYGTTHAYHLCLSKDMRCKCIKVTIRCDDSESPLRVLEFLHHNLTAITNGDFQKVKYTIGPACPACNGENGETDVHVLSLASGNDVVSGAYNQFWCHGVLITINEGKIKPDGETGQIPSSPIRESRGGSFNGSPLQTLDDDTRIENLPHSLYREIRDTLRIPSIRGRDYKGLAGLLGKTFREVSLLELEPNPCDALFKDWITYDDATLGHLINHMKTLEHYDIISAIDEYKSQM